MDAPKLIISRAHEVVQKVPLKDEKYKCIRCGMEGDLADLYGPKRCTPHAELASSGWKDES